MKGMMAAALRYQRGGGMVKVLHHTFFGTTMTDPALRCGPAGGWQRSDALGKTAVALVPLLPPHAL